MTVIYRDLNGISEKVLERAFFVMSEDRREKCMRLISDVDKKRCIAADMLAREIIAQKTGMSEREIVFGTAENGKPFVKNAEVFFNVSHSGHYAAAALSENGEVGIDVECFRPVSPSVTRFFCSDVDLDFIFGEAPVPQRKKITDSETLVRFFRVWCFKEAFFKRTGEGIGKHAALIDYNPAGVRELLLPDGVISAVGV